MAGLADFRAQHPEYNDMPDGVLADKLYQKFYSDMPRDQFNSKMGLSMGQGAASEASTRRDLYPGMTEPGNIDVAGRPVVKNPDGSISTVRSMSFNDNGREVLIPTVSNDGRIMTNQEAVDTYYRTGQHLGKFDTPANADKYAQNLHETQAIMYRQKPTKLERFGTGATDPVVAASQLAAHSRNDTATQVMKWLDEKIRNNLPGFENLPAYNPPSAESVDQRVTQREKDYQAARGPNAGFDWYRLGGNIAATAPLAFAAPEGLIGAAGVGAVTGGLQPVTDQGNFWGQKTGQTLFGAGGGAAGYGVGKLASRLLAPKVTADVKALMDRGVTPTPGQIMGGKAAVLEEKASSVPVLGGVIKGGQRRAMDQFNRAVYQDVLDPIGAKAPQSIGREAVAAVGDTISQGYDDVLSNPNVVFRPDMKFAQDLGNIANMAKNLPTEEARQFGNYMKNTVAKALGPSGQMDGRAFKTLESDLRNKAARLMASPDAYQKDLGDAFNSLLGTLRETLARSNQGVTVNVGGKAVDAASRLGNLNAAWARLVRLEKAAGVMGQKEAGVFTPSQFSSAVKAADQSVRKRAYARGDALMQELADAGKSVLGSKYPDSGTAGRLMTGGLATALLTGGAFSPAALAAGGGIGVGMLPYTALGQRLAAYLLAGSRPAAAKAAGSAVERAAPFMGTGLAALLTGRQ